MKGLRKKIIVRNILAYVLGRLVFSACFLLLILIPTFFDLNLILYPFCGLLAAIVSGICAYFTLIKLCNQKQYIYDYSVRDNYLYMYALCANGIILCFASPFIVIGAIMKIVSFDKTAEVLNRYGTAITEVDRYSNIIISVTLIVIGLCWLFFGVYYIYKAKRDVRIRGQRYRARFFDNISIPNEQPKQDVFNNDEYITNTADNIEPISNIKPKFCTKKEEYAEPPYLDVNELVFKSDDEIKTAQTEYAQKMAEYVKNSGKKKVKYIFNISKRAIILSVVSLMLLMGSGVFWGYYIAKDGKIIEYNPSVYTSTNDFKYHLEGCSKLNPKTEKIYTLKYVKKFGYKKCDICGSGKYEKYLDEEDL